MPFLITLALFLPLAADPASGGKGACDPDGSHGNGTNGTGPGRTIETSGACVQPPVPPPPEPVACYCLPERIGDGGSNVTVEGSGRA